MATACCMRCRRNAETRNPKQTIIKNNRPATQGVCLVCRTKVLGVGKGKAVVAGAKTTEAAAYLCADG